MLAETFLGAWFTTKGTRRRQVLQEARSGSDWTGGVLG
jgi:hypothetical protein